MIPEENKRLILIDDDPVTNVINTRIISRHLSQQVIVFTDAHEALDQLKEWTTVRSLEFPDIIFLDINMPQMDGWDFLNEFQKLPDHFHKKCRVIMLTSSIDLSDVKRSKTYTSVTDFISKPLTPEKLRALLSTIA
jgi:CheY-like chemotaxis protein